MRTILFCGLAALAAAGLLPLAGCIEGSGLTEAIVFMSEAPFSVSQTRVATPWVWLMTANGLDTAPVNDFVSPRTAMGSLSPDGTRIVYTVPGSAILLYDLATGSVNEIYSGDDPRTPAWSPDGSTIVFSDSASASSGSSIYTMDANGGGVTELRPATSFERFLAPKYNRAGSKIAFQDGQEGGDLYIMDANGTNEDFLVSGTTCLHPSFLPDGRVLYVQLESGWYEIWIINADGSSARSLTGGISALEGFSKFYPTCNYAGTAVAFGVGSQSSGDIYVAPFDGTNLGTPVNVTAGISDPCWRPDFGRVRADLYTLLFNPPVM